MIVNGVGITGFRGESLNRLFALVVKARIGIRREWENDRRC